MIFSLQRLLIINEIRIMYNVYNILLIEIDLAQFHPKWEEEERGWCDSEVQCFFFLRKKGTQLNNTSGGIWKIINEDREIFLLIK